MKQNDISEIRLKLSRFCYVSNATIRNDLHDRITPIEGREIELLNLLQAQELTRSEIFTRLPHISSDQLQRLFEIGVIVASSTEEWRDVSINYVDIETCRACNASCFFCPQSLAPKAQRVLSMDQFDQILKRISDQPIKWIALNHYNEPLMDPLFVQRLESLRDHGLKLRLFTNGSLLTEQHFISLSQTPVDAFVFNLPSLDPETWSSIMSIPAKLHGRIISAIQRALDICAKSDTRTEIAVNVLNRSQLPRVKQIREYFGNRRNFRVAPVYTNSRAGILTEESLASKGTFPLVASG